MSMYLKIKIENEIERRNKKQEVRVERAQIETMQCGKAILDYKCESKM